MTITQSPVRVYSRGTQGPPGPSNVYNVKNAAFGAKGDGTTDDTGAIQDAINVAAAAGGAVYIPHGTYRITSTLTIADDDEHGNQKGVRVFGDNGGTDYPSGYRTVLVWDGASSTSPLLGVYSRACIVERIHFDVTSGRTLKCAIASTKASGTHAGVCSNNIFRYMRIARDVGGTLTDGIRIGDQVNGSYPTNCEWMTFENIYFSNVTHASVYVPNNTGQCKSHTFYRCDFSLGQYGLYYQSGSFHMDHCGFGQITVSALWMNQVTDVITIKSTDSEGCKKFLGATVGGTSNPWPITIMGGRLSVDTSIVGPTDKFITVQNQGALTMIGCLIETTNYATNFVAVEVGDNTETSTGKFVAIGCVFCENGSLSLVGGVVRQRKIILGCNIAKQDTSCGVMDDQIFGSGSNGVETPSVLRDRMRLGNAFITNNVAGTVNISASATTATVTLPTTEADASYDVQVSVDTITGSFTPGTVWVSGKSTTGFTVNISSAPGGSNVAKIVWSLTRGS